MTATTSIRRAAGASRATGASVPRAWWRAEDGLGDRKLAALGPLTLESGRTLPELTMAYETFGELDAACENAVLVLHALTGDSHAAGPADAHHPTPGWWDAMIGPGRPLDTRRFCVIVPNVLGGCQGSTGPSTPAPDGHAWGSRFPTLTVRDQVAAEDALRARLGIESFALVIGGSMGGMRALEWAITLPSAVERLAVVASGARASADQIAWNSAQLAAIRADPGFHGGDYYDLADAEGPRTGLGIARSIAHTTYRSAAEFETRFSHRAQPGEDPLTGQGRHQVTSYLEHHARKLVSRFDANSYLRLVEAMNTHDVGRGRGGVPRALARIRARTLAVGIDADRLFPAQQAREIAAGAAGEYRELHSMIGHDAFLLPSPDLDGWITTLLSD